MTWPWYEPQRLPVLIAKKHAILGDMNGFGRNYNHTTYGIRDSFWGFGLSKLDNIWLFDLFVVDLFLLVGLGGKLLCLWTSYYVIRDKACCGWCFMEFAVAWVEDKKRTCFKLSEEAFKLSAGPAAGFELSRIASRDCRVVLLELFFEILITNTNEHFFSVHIFSAYLL